MLFYSPCTQSIFERRQFFLLKIIFYKYITHVHVAPHGNIFQGLTRCSWKFFLFVEACLIVLSPFCQNVSMGPPRRLSNVLHKLHRPREGPGCWEGGGGFTRILTFYLSLPVFSPKLPPSLLSLLPFASPEQKNINFSCSI